MKKICCVIGSIIISLSVSVVSWATPLLLTDFCAIAFIGGQSDGKQWSNTPYTAKVNIPGKEALAVSDVTKVGVQLTFSTDTMNQSIGAAAEYEGYVTNARQLKLSFDYEVSMSMTSSNNFIGYSLVSFGVNLQREPAWGFNRTFSNHGDGDLHIAGQVNKIINLDKNKIYSLWFGIEGYVEGHYLLSRAVYEGHVYSFLNNIQLDIIPVNAPLPGAILLLGAGLGGLALYGRRKLADKH